MATHDAKQADEIAGEAVPGSRRSQILEVAAQIFARRGYRGTSMRHIGDEAGVLGGSLYHHIKSKDALFVELHNGALDAAARRIETAIAGAGQQPWDRLKAACIELLEIQLDPDSLTLPMMNDFREVPAEVRHDLINRRDRFEEQFRNLVDAVPLPPMIDRSIYRYLLLTLLNNSADWYRPGRMSPREIAEQIVYLFRHER
jgi:AcrR family transcriptional regulator